MIVNRAAFNRRFSMLVAVVALTLAATGPLYLPPFVTILLISVFMFIVLAVSWTSFSSSTRYISLATAAFFGVGVYTSAIFEELPLLAVIGIGGLASLLLGLLVGLTTLRLSGMYFAIFTFGLSELLHHSMTWYEINITGTLGRWVPLLAPEPAYYSMLALVVATLLAAYLLRRSRFGLALQAIGQAEEAAAHIGINVKFVKIITFAGTCFFIGAAGTIMARRWSYIDPELAFAPFLTFFVIMMVLLGGMESPFYGPVLGATAISVLLDTVLTGFPHQTFLIFGSILILVIVFLPKGLAGLMGRIVARGKVLRE